MEVTSAFCPSLYPGDPAQLYLNKLILLYQTISADKSLSAKLRKITRCRTCFNDGTFVAQGCNEFEGCCSNSTCADSDVTCNSERGSDTGGREGDVGCYSHVKDDGCVAFNCICDPQAEAEVNADVSALRLHLLKPNNLHNWYEPGNDTAAVSREVGFPFTCFYSMGNQGLNLSWASRGYENGGSGSDRTARQDATVYAPKVVRCNDANSSLLIEEENQSLGIHVDCTKKVSRTYHYRDIGTCEVSNVQRLVLPLAVQKQNLSFSSGRTYVDGIFDLLHSGHFNALRQARMLGHYLVVGINSDNDAFSAKGCWPIYTQEERAEIMCNCKWVDEVVIGTPYNVSVDLLDALHCSHAAHGDDWVVGADGRDAYHGPRAAGRMKTFPRTEGISTTTIISRLLDATVHLCNSQVAVELPQSVEEFARQSLADAFNEKGERSVSDEAGKPMFKKESGTDWKVLMSSRRLLQFIGETRKPKPTDTIVYVDGSFDVFHVGHVRILQKAKQLGDYLIVGIHDDATVAHKKGPGFPVLNLYERALNVLAMRMVDEVIIGAPWTVGDYLLKSLRVDIVVRGTRIDSTAETVANSGCKKSYNCDEKISNEGDPYRIPKKLGIYKEIESSSFWTTNELVKRLLKNKEALSASLNKRTLKEKTFWNNVSVDASRKRIELV